MSRFKFINTEQHEQIKKICEFLNVKYEVDSDGYIVVNNENHFILEDLQNLVRTLKFPLHSWDIHLLGEDKECDDRFINYLKNENIEYIEEFDEGMRWITISDDQKIPESVFKKND